jgi:hypothetical protein
MTYKTAEHNLGTTRFAQSVLEQLWADAVRKQIMEDIVRPEYVDVPTAEVLRIAAEEALLIDGRDDAEA